MLTKPLVRSIVRPITTAISASLGSGFSPVSFFTASDMGFIYDNNDLTTFFADSAGTTAASVNGPVGLQLDKSRGLVLGSELVTNGGFATDISGWTIVGSGPTATVSGGIVSIASNGVSGGIRQDITVGNGSWSEVRIRARKSSGSSSAVLFLVPRADFASPNEQLIITSSSFQEYVFRIKADATVIRVYLQVIAGDAVMEVDSVSVKELPGLHRYQTTAGDRPTLRGTPTGANLVTNGDFASATGWTLSNGATIGSGSLNFDGVTSTSSGASFATNSSFSPTAGRVYRVTWTIVSGTSFPISINFGGVSGQPASSAGTYVDYITASNGNGLGVIARSSTGARTGSVDNIDIRDVSADSVTAPYGLQANGVNSWLTTASANFTNTDKMTVCMGVRKLSDAAQGMFVELSASVAANNGTFHLTAPNSAANNYAFASKGTISATDIESGFTAPHTAVLTGIGNISGDNALLHVNSTVGTAVTTDQGTGNYGNYAFFFMRRGGTTLPANILDMGGACIGKELSATQLAQLKRWVAQRTGVTL